MGKNASVIQFTGRAGTVVGARGQDGDIGLGQHRNHVKEKNAQGQTANRSKMTHAGGQSQPIPSEQIQGVSGSGSCGHRRRRQKLILKMVTASGCIVMDALVPVDLVEALLPERLKKF